MATTLPVTVDGTTGDYPVAGMALIDSVFTNTGKTPVVQNITNANYTLLATDDAVYFTCGLTSRTCTLPDPTTVTPGKPFDIYKIDGGVGLLTAIGTVDGGNNPIVALTLLRGHLRITSNGTVWCSG